MIDALRVDFIAVPTQDMKRAARFYEQTLGLRRSPNGDLDGNGLMLHHRYAPYPDGREP